MHKKLIVGDTDYGYPACGQTDCFWAYQACTGISADKRHEALYGKPAYALSYPCHDCTYNEKRILEHLKNNKQKVTKKQILSIQGIV